MTESRRAVSARSIPTDVGEAVTSVGVGGTRDELRIVVTTAPGRAAAAGVGGPGRVATGGVQASVESAIKSASAPRSRVVCILSKSYPTKRHAFVLMQDLGPPT